MAAPPSLRMAETYRTNIVSATLSHLVGETVIGQWASARAQNIGVGEGSRPLVRMGSIAEESACELDPLTHLSTVSGGAGAAYMHLYGLLPGKSRM